MEHTRVASIQPKKVRVSIQQIMYSNTSNIFQQNPSQKMRYIFGSSQKLGSYRVQEGQQFFRVRPQDINGCWADSPPLSITTKQEVLHLSAAELRVEDYFLIRNKLVTPEHQQMVNRAIKENAYNEMLNRVPCKQPMLLIFPYPFDIEGIKRAKQIHKSRKSYTKPSQVNQVVNIFDRNPNKQLQSSKPQNSSSNIFTPNQTTGLTQAPPSNIFSRSTSASNIYQPVANTSNNQYRPSSSNTNTQNCSAGNVFTVNTPKEQAKVNIFSSSVQNNTAINQPNKNVSSNNIFNNPNNLPNNNNTKQNINNIFNNSNNTPKLASSNNNINNIFNNNNNNKDKIFSNNNTPNIASNNNNLFNSSNTPIVPSNNNIFNNNKTPIFSSNNNIFTPNISNNNSSNNIFNNSNNNQLPQNNIPYNGQNIFKRNIFNQLCNNPSHNQQNLKKQIQISIKLSEDNVVYQKIITTDNNIKIHLDYSHMVQPARPRQQNPAFNRVIVAKSEHSDKNTDRTKEERERKMPEKEKQEMPVKSEKIVTIHNFQEKEEEVIEESWIRKCSYQLRLCWLEEGKEDRCIKGTMNVEGFFPNDDGWCRHFINRLKLDHPSVRKDAEPQELVCKIDPKGNATITGKITQKLINLPNYDVEYKKLTNGYAEGLKISNNHGSISWQQPVRLVELDFQQLGFAINENEVLMPKNSPLNTACLVTFYRLPFRVEMLLEADDYDGAFEKLTKIVEKGSQGTATLRELGQDFWRMHVTKFS